MSEEGHSDPMMEESGLSSVGIDVGAGYAKAAVYQPAYDQPEMVLCGVFLEIGRLWAPPSFDTDRKSVV